jgi:hypothetical protein
MEKTRTTISAKTADASTASATWLPIAESEVVDALKNALTKGAKESISIASAVDGFYRNPKLFIPWPAEAEKMKTVLSSLGLSSQVATVEKTINRAAEEASKSAFEVFVSAIKNMTVKDGIAIVTGGDNAATEYLRQTTSNELSEKFKPIVKKAIGKVKLTSYWNPLMKKYNKIPGVQKQNPDLEQYITDKAIDGLMVLIAEEEAKIRKDPAGQVTDILNRILKK